MIIILFYCYYFYYDCIILTGLLVMSQLMRAVQQLTAERNVILEQGRTAASRFEEVFALWGFHIVGFHIVVFHIVVLIFLAFIHALYMIFISVTIIIDCYGYCYC